MTLQWFDNKPNDPGSESISDVPNTDGDSGDRVPGFVGLGLFKKLVFSVAIDPPAVVQREVLIGKHVVRDLKRLNSHCFADITQLLMLS
jgi:hypothetical protein